MYSKLNKKAQEKLNDVFTRHGHNPTADQLTAVLDIQHTLTLMLSGNAAPKYYLSSLDPGMGKTTSILTWLEAYLEDHNEYGNQGVLIALDRLEQIPDWIKDCKIPENTFAVLVSDDTDEGIELNNSGLGRHRRQEALVLFTTKKQIRNNSMVAFFNHVCRFHFQGQPRNIKVWDESFTLGEEVILNPCEFGAILSQMDSISTELASSLLQLINGIRKFDANGTYFIPTLPKTPKDAEHSIYWDTHKERNVANLLWRISGQPVSIHYYNKQQVIVDSSPKIPDDFAPCLILDASARLKKTYQLQDEARKDIQLLHYSSKSYRNLEVRLWNRTSGKQIINDINEVVPELVALMVEHHTEDFLIILHKGHKVAIKRALSKELSREQIAKVKFCTWARHNATNEFSEIANIIMLSPYQAPDHAYEAMTRAATAMTTARRKPKQDDINRVKKGEISSNILQAVNRGKVRKSEGDTCPPCRLWLITHPKTGIAKELDNIFPECKVTPWKVKVMHLTSGKQRKTFAHLQALVQQGFTEVMAKTVREHLGFTDSASNFTRDVIKQSVFVDALASIRWECVKNGINYVFRGFNAIEAS